MRILLDTSILVEVDRKNEKAIALLQKIIENGDELIISTVTVAEILTGSYLHHDPKTAITKAKEVLNQCIWKEIDGETAEIAAQLYSHLFLEKKQEQIEYPDVLIAATFFSSGSDVLLTLNVKDFILFEALKEKVYTPEAFTQKMLKEDK